MARVFRANASKVDTVALRYWHDKTVPGRFAGGSRPAAVGTAAAAAVRCPAPEARRRPYSPKDPCCTKVTVQGYLSSCAWWEVYKPPCVQRVFAPGILPASGRTTSATRIRTGCRNAYFRRSIHLNSVLGKSKLSSLSRPPILQTSGGFDVIPTPPPEPDIRFHDKQDAGGMPTADGSRKRTAGGVFFTLLKQHMEPAKLKELYADEIRVKKEKERARRSENKRKAAAALAGEDVMTPRDPPRSRRRGGDNGDCTSTRAGRDMGTWAGPSDGVGVGGDAAKHARASTSSPGEGEGSVASRTLLP